MAETFKIVRVFRHLVDGVLQVSDFPEGAPEGDSDLEIRTRHITEIEAFTNFGVKLGQELFGGLEHVQATIGLKVANPRVQTQIDNTNAVRLSDERLADLLEDVGLNWEHSVANTNGLLIPGNPTKISDPVFQALIDSLDEFTEALVREVNRRALERKKKHA